jgi:hypothetical protein
VRKCEGEKVRRYEGGEKVSLIYSTGLGSRGWRDELFRLFIGKGEGGHDLSFSSPLAMEGGKGEIKYYKMENAKS